MGPTEGEAEGESIDGFDQCQVVEFSRGQFVRQCRSNSMSEVSRCRFNRQRRLNVRGTALRDHFVR